VGDRRGAVYVEFLAVFWPLFTFFMCLVQFAFLQTASIIVNHAAMKAARIAAVVIYGDPAEVGGVGQGTVAGMREEMIKQAGQFPLTALGNAGAAKVTTDKNSYARDEMVTVTVEYDYLCRVPLGRTFVCGVGSTKTIIGKAALPNQGASFTY
jgi:hypothetical protein